MKIFSSRLGRSNSNLISAFVPKFKFSSTVDEIKMASNEKKFFYPIKGLPQFQKEQFSVFECSPPKLESDESGSFIKLPQVPYEIKEHALKGALYTFFLIWGGRFLTNFSSSFINVTNTAIYPYIPLCVFTYHYLKPLYYMANAITAIRLKEDGLKVVLEFKNIRKPLEVEIWRITKGREETFLNECYTEPFLFPINIDYTDIYGQYSLKSKRKFYIYGDSNSCIKDGEIFRAILNSQSIKLN